MHSKNLLMPCSIRDHYKNFQKSILTTETQGENEAAQGIMSEDEYLKHLDAYDTELDALTQPIWQKEYIEKDAEQRKESNAQ